MKTIRVAAAIIADKGRVFATRRGYGDQKGGWEFPGGKLEPDESPQQALTREIREELATDIQVLSLIDTLEYDYPAFHLSMDCFLCRILKGELTLLEAEASAWLSADRLYSVDWLPADRLILEKVSEILKSGI